MKDLKIVEEFNEWRAGRSKRNHVRNSIISVIWTLSVFIYLTLGMFLGVWHPSWMIFLLAAVATHIVNITYALKEDK